MHLWQLIFYVSCGLVFYNYAGYAVIVFLLNKITGNRQEAKDDPGFRPSVAFIVAAYNEEDVIKQKIVNSLEQDYPRDKIEFIFITDGSSDNTPLLITQSPGIRLLHRPERSGKSAALNRAVAEATQDIIIASDANTLLNKDAVKNIVRHYRSAETGGVAGEKKVLSANTGAEDVGAGEGLYWKYESALKKLDADFYSVVGAAGELFSLRRTLYEPLPHDVILDDFVLSLRVAQKGYRIRYEPDAYAMELPSFSMKDEQKRKVRIAAGGFQAIGMLTPLLAFWKYPRLTFLYVSHRLLRWTLSPLCLILALLANAALLPAGTLYVVLFAAQAGFYGISLLARLFPTIRNRIKLAKLAYYFTFMNLSVILGFFRFLRGRQSATWEKAHRTPQPAPGD
ncbi:glycosyltransferase family 2 protein [Puia sp.]|jgi:cellulose synthase/poly-beta-1,6-N-acetylglucosamine synthase-like glycosyltransferase|uniref:glycosyltransferase family 2 protein n=1 Tax=Puia sp. TaxID=2045100 RepID=UPI002F417A2C